MNAALAFFLWFTAAFLPQATISGPAKIAVPVTINAGGLTPTVAFLCAVNGGSCTFSGVTTGMIIEVELASEGSITGQTMTDSCGDSATGLIHDGAGGAFQASVYIVTTCNATSLSVSAGSTWYIAYSVTPNTGSAGVTATCPTGGTCSSTTSFSVGPTSAVGASSVCFAAAAMDPQETMTAGSGWALAPGTNNYSNGDNRALAVETMTVASGTVTGTMTAASTTGGGMTLQCFPL